MSAPVAVAPVVRRNVQMEQAFVGSVMPARESEIGSAVDGRVVEYPIQQGEYVQKDQKLAQLLTGLLEIEKRLAEAERDLRQQELLEMQNGMRREEVERARAQLASRKALSDYAKNRLIRLQKLTQQGTITEDEIQDAVARPADRPTLSRSQSRPRHGRRGPASGKNRPSQSPPADGAGSR
jgi:multidrug resistance efflux pump